MRSAMRSRLPGRPPRRGGAAVEFALVAPFLVTVLLGMFEISRAILVKETLSNAAQQGCRTGSHPGTANSDISTDVDNVMSGAGLNGYTVTIQVNGTAGDVT